MLCNKTKWPIEQLKTTGSKAKPTWRWTWIKIIQTLKRTTMRELMKSMKMRMALLTSTGNWNKKRASSYKNSRWPKIMKDKWKRLCKGQMPWVQLSILKLLLQRKDSFLKIKMKETKQNESHLQVGNMFLFIYN